MNYVRLQLNLAFVARSKHRPITNLITAIFQSFEFEPKTEITYYKTGSTPSEQLDKYFVIFWPYPMVNKVKGAVRRGFTLATDIIFRENIRRLALMHGMRVNEFIVETLTLKMVNEIEKDPMLLRHIPYY